MRRLSAAHRPPLPRPAKCHSGSAGPYFLYYSPAPPYRSGGAGQGMKACQNQSSFRFFWSMGVDTWLSVATARVVIPNHTTPSNHHHQRSDSVALTPAGGGRGRPSFEERRIKRCDRHDAQSSCLSPVAASEPVLVLEVDDMQKTVDFGRRHQQRAWEFLACRLQKCRSRSVR